VVRAALEKNYDIEFVAVNDLTSADALAHLFKYDSVHGTILNDVKAGPNSISIDGREMRVFSSPDPAAIPWGDLGVTIVVESSGRFTDKAKASAHLKNGVETVIISAPSKDADATFCMGVNDETYDARSTRSSRTPRARRTASRRWRRCCTSASASRQGHG
jgi:glyceraldehyde 3-phosphate dehydrogenase